MLYKSIFYFLISLTLIVLLYMGIWLPDLKFTMTKEVEYITTKAAIIQLTRYLAQYLKSKDIRVNCICPGGILNNQPKSFIQKYNTHCNKKGMLDGEDVVGTIVFLLSDLATHLTGQNIVIDDGFSL